MMQFLIMVRNAMFFCMTIILFCCFIMVTFLELEKGKANIEVFNFTDSLTGCMYLVTRAGGLTPKLSAGGRQVGCRYLDRDKT